MACRRPAAPAARAGRGWSPPRAPARAGRDTGTSAPFTLAPALARGVDLAAQDDLAVLGREAVRFEDARAAPALSTSASTTACSSPVRMSSGEARAAQEEAEGVDEDRLAGPGFPGEDGQSPRPNSSSTPEMTAIFFIFRSLSIHRAAAPGRRITCAPRRFLDSHYLLWHRRPGYTIQRGSVSSSLFILGQGSTAFSGGLGGYLGHVGPVAAGVLVLLVLFSLVSWAIIIFKGIALRRALRPVADIPGRFPQEQQVLRGQLRLLAAHGEPAGGRVPGRLPRGEPAGAAGRRAPRPPPRRRGPPCAAWSRSRARWCARPPWSRRGSSGA